MIEYDVLVNSSKGGYAHVGDIKITTPLTESQQVQNIFRGIDARSPGMKRYKVVILSPRRGSNGQDK